MTNTERNSVFVVDYMSGSSVVHECMTMSDYMYLLKKQNMGFVKIMHRTDHGRQTKTH